MYKDIGFLFIEEDIIAACADPIPGKKPTKIEENNPKLRFFIKFFIFIFGDVKIWFGIFIFSFIERINDEVPNNPENNGNSGSFIFFRFKTMYPNKPEIVKIINEFNGCLSLNIRTMDVVIKTYGIKISIIS